MILSVTHDVVLVREAPSQALRSCLLAAMPVKLQLKLGGLQLRQSRAGAGVSVADGFLRSKTSPTPRSGIVRLSDRKFKVTLTPKVKTLQRSSGIRLLVWPHANPNKLQLRASHVLQ